MAIRYKRIRRARSEWGLHLGIRNADVQTGKMTRSTKIIRNTRRLSTIGNRQLQEKLELPKTSCDGLPIADC